jgi:DNA-binding MarR family transcriptional regulator
MAGRSTTADVVASVARHPLADDVNWLLNRVWLGFGEARSKALESLGLTVREHVLMHVLENVDGTQLELAAVIRMDKSVLTTTVDGLERRGLVRRVPDARDRRAKRPELTEAGAALCRQADRVSAGVQDDLLAGLGAAEREAFVGVLTTFAFGPFAGTQSFAQQS